MAARTVSCRVCGKEFVPCNKPSSALGAFNYRAVACSPECGTEYLRRVQEARRQTVSSGAPDAEASTSAVETVVTENAAALLEKQEGASDFSERISRKRRRVMKRINDTNTV